MLNFAIGPTGLLLPTQAELVAYYGAQFQAIYGNDINLDPSTPDGQLINILVQADLDYQDLLTQIYNGFDPDNAIGAVLDQRVAINGIQRQAGTFTITNVTLVVAQALNLSGLDQNINPIYTVADSAGNQWELITSQVISGPGTYVFAFQAANPGMVLTIPNTITIPVSVVVGVTAINNPTTYNVLGVNEESDVALKIRRQKSVGLASQGYYAGLLAALENLNGISSAYILENDTDTTDTHGVPSHSIWVIIDGTAPAADIAQTIYNYRNAGCGMFGDTQYVITQVDGTPFLIQWDVVTPETIYIAFTVTSLDGINPPNIAGIRAGLPTSFVPGVAQEVNINGLATAVQEIDSNTLVTNAGFSTSPTGPFTNTLTPTSPKFQFAVSEPNIIIIPMILEPTISTVPHGTTKQFTALGGFGTLTYSILVNNSGGSINSSTGLYTAGSTPSNDTIQVTDSQSHTATATVNVT